MSSLNKQALLRYRIIDELIRRRNYPTMQDILDLCEERLGKRFSKETIQKDIETMKYDLSLGYEAPIKYNRKYKGYEYTDKNFSINTTNLSPYEKEQIKSASEILLQFKESKLGESLKTTLQRLNILINSPELLHNKIIEFDDSGFNKYDLLLTLYQAIKNKSKVNFVYYCHRANDISAYTVQPLLLKEYKRNWYLIVKNKNNEPQALNLNFIFDVIEIESNTNQEDFIDYDKYLENSIGVQVDSAYLQEVEILFKAELALEIKTNPLHKSQKIIKEYENGDTLASYKLYITDELISEILSYGSNAFVTKNKELQEEILSELQENFVEYRRVLKHW